MAPCAICEGRLEPFAEGRVLRKREVSYFRCAACGSVSLPSPDWLDEAYSDAISSLDVGLLERGVQLANIATSVISSERLRSGRFLDFAGGYGTLTRIMRDRGLDFHHHDPLCENIFAVGFEGTLDERYDMITAIEVLEHLPDPVVQLAPVAACTDLMLLTTQVLPSPAPKPGSWDYYYEDAGQHITFYTVPGLRALAGSLGMELATSGRLVHAFHRRPLRSATKVLLRDERLAYAAGAVRSEFARRRGLTLSDQRTAMRRLGKDNS